MLSGVESMSASHYDKPLFIDALNDGVTCEEVPFQFRYGLYRVSPLQNHHKLEVSSKSIGTSPRITPKQ